MDLDEVCEKVAKMEEDMYKGRGKDDPPIVTRLDRLEVAGAKVDKLTWVVIAGAVAALLDAISHHVGMVK